MSRLPSPQPDPAPPADPSLHADPGTPARPEETDVTILDNRHPAAPPHPAVPPRDLGDFPAPGAENPPRSRHDDEARPTTAPAPAGRASGSTRDPHARLESLFDPRSLSLLTPEDASRALTGTGAIDGMPAVAFPRDPRGQGGPTC